MSVNKPKCQKAPHTGTGYLHDADDDRPYDVDGVLYCGRCHRSLDACQFITERNAAPKESKPVCQVPGCPGDGSYSNPHDEIAHTEYERRLVPKESKPEPDPMLLDSIKASMRVEAEARRPTPPTPEPSVRLVKSADPVTGEMIYVDAPTPEPKPCRWPHHAQPCGVCPPEPKERYRRVRPDPFWSDVCLLCGCLVGDRAIHDVACVVKGGK
jgi:hypothetical protein